MLATVGFVALTGAGWGLVAPATRLLFDLDRQGLDGASVTVARATWCGCAWLPAFAFFAWRERRALDRRTVARLVTLGAIWGPGVMGLFAIATQRTALSHVVFSVGLTPVAAGVLSTLLYGGTIDGPRRAALVIGALGASLFAFGKTSAHATPLGDAILLAWVLAFGLYAAVALAALRKVSALLVTAAANVVGGTLLSAASLFVPAWRDAIGAVATHPQLALPFFGGIVVMGGVVAPLAYSYALGRAPVSVVTGASQYVSIAVGTVAAILLFGERFGVVTIAAGILLIGSLGVSLLPARERAAI